MKTTCRLVGFVVLGIAGLVGRARAADAPPLLVVVEVAPGVDVDPSDVRQAVAAELGTSVVGARDAAAGDASDVLLVTLDPREIRMSLRAGAAPVVSRTVASSGERPSRLRSIGWLAGNLVRDQVGPIVSTRPSPLPGAESHPATEPPALATAPATQDATGPEAVVASRAATEPAVVHSTWAITAGGGPTAAAIDWTSVISSGSAYYIEAQRQASPDALQLGVAVEMAPQEAFRTHYLGVAAFFGSGWHGRRFFLEGTIGLGLELLQGWVKTLTVTNNSAQVAPVSETTVTIEPVPGLYARLAGTGGVRLTRTFDLVARLGAHVSSTGLGGSFLSSTVGVRLRLP